jgi:hypothetical protein
MATQILCLFKALGGGQEGDVSFLKLFAQYCTCSTSKPTRRKENENDVGGASRGPEGVERTKSFRWQSQSGTGVKRSIVASCRGLAGVLRRALRRQLASGRPPPL